MSYPSVVLSDAPAGYWRLNESSGTKAYETTLNNLTSTYKQAATTAQPAGIAAVGLLSQDANRAVLLNGTSEFVEVTHSSVLNLGDTFTLEAWIKRDTALRSESLISKGTGAYLLTFFNAADDFIYLRKGGTGNCVRSSVALAAGTTYHVVATHSPTNGGKIYVNGVDVTVAIGAQTFADTSVTLGLGAVSGGSAFFKGVLDEVAVYNTELSAARVAAHYTAGTTASPNESPSTFTYQGLHHAATWWTPDVALKEIDIAHGIGANVARIAIDWSALETSKGVYDATVLARLDAAIGACAARRMKVIAEPWACPSWAGGGTTQSPPTSASDYGDLAAFIVGRYGSKLCAFEVWNEPNISAFWTGTKQQYVDLCQAAYTSIKAIRSDVLVLAGAVSNCDWLYVSGLYTLGVRSYMDRLSVHPYDVVPGPTKLERVSQIVYSFKAGVERFRAFQLAAGDTTPLWFTEYGYSQGADGDLANVSDATQALYEAQAVAQIAEWGFVECAIKYMIRATGTSTSRENGFGLLANDFTTRAAYESMKTAWAPYAPARPARWGIAV